MLKYIAKITGKHPALVIKLRCLKRLKKWPDLKNPDNIFEQMMALALENGSNPLWSVVADKIAVHDYVKKYLSNDYTNEIYGVWDKPDDIDFDNLPDKFVLKTNNSCGTNIIVTDKKSIDKTNVKKTLQKWLDFPYGQLTGQMHYAQIPPRILAEELLTNDKPDQSSSLIDYKFLCFNGKPACMYIYYNRQPNSHKPWTKLFDGNGNPLTKYMLQEDIDHPEIELPESFDQMLEAAKILSKPFPLVRIDFYEVERRPILGEMSLTPGLELTTPEFLTDMQKIYLETKKHS